MGTGDQALRQGGARGAAVRMLMAVTEARETLSDAAAAAAGLTAPDRARAQRLALATLRHIEPADAILKALLRKGPPPAIRAILRLATVEIMAEGGDPHGVVNAAVSLARAAGRQEAGFAGLVNAVLRKAAATPSEVWAGSPAQTLPGWLRGRLMSAYGSAATRAIEAAHRQGAATDLTPRDGDAEALAERVGGTVLPTGSLRLKAGGAISDLPGYAAGAWWVQDAAAALPARALAARPGERILDLCAAPGGKTLQLAAAGADVTALDLSAARMARVAENLSRCGLTARTVIADALTWEGDGLFDAVLLDAPCSATGTIRRHPDLPFVRDPATLKPLATLQSALIDRAAGWVRPGGRMVFATCSLLPEEGERQVAAALSRLPEWSADPVAALVPGVDPDWAQPEGGIRLRPDRWADLGGMDGFYYAVLRRSA